MGFLATRNWLTSSGAVAAILLVLAATASFSQAESISPTAHVLVAAGDIADCASNGDEATAALLDGIDGTIAALGDTAYPEGSAAQFAECYAPTWGRHKWRTRPAVGNHEYLTPRAGGYFGYFGAAAGDPAKGYYSYDLGSWHVVVLNSNCEQVGGCFAGTQQERWLRADLNAHQAGCTLAYWHDPRFSSGVNHGSNPKTRFFWQALHEHGADVVLSGHDHDYERFALQNPDGQLDEERGIRQFVVGTGGRKLNGFGAVQPNSEVRNADTYGVLELTLSDGAYAWQFVPVAGGSFADSGSAPCHGPAVPAPTAPPSPSPTLPATPAPPGELLANRGFEHDAGGDGAPDRWSASPRFARSAAAAHWGAYSGRFRAADDSGAAVSQAVPGLRPGVAYAAACWVNIPATADAFGFTLAVRWRDAAGARLESHRVKAYAADTGGAWVKAARTLTAPARAAGAELVLAVESLGATVYVDDCSFRPAE